MFVALPISRIQEVVPRPAELCVIPATIPELLGSINLRGTMVPVIDLSRMLGGEADAGAAAPIVMVIRISGGVLGVPVHEVCGVLDLSSERQTPLERRPGTVASALTRAGFCDGDCHGVILDADALAAIPGMVLAEDRVVDDLASLSGRTPTLVFAAGSHLFGLAAEVIEATVPSRMVHECPIDDPLWIGKIDHNGARVPLVDTLRLLGLGASVAARETPSIVIRMGPNLRIALQIDRVIDMARIRRDDCLPFADFSIDTAGIVAGLHRSDQTIFMLDPERLRGHPALLDLAGLEETGDGELAAARTTAGGGTTSGAGSSISGGRQPYLIFSLAEDHHAVPLHQVSEILDVSSLQLIDLGESDSGFAAMIAHRGSAIPIVDLAARLGMPANPGSAFVLIVEAGGRFTGFRLQNLRAVERHAARQLGQIGLTSTGEAIQQDVIITSDGVTCLVLDMQRFMPCSTDEAGLAA